MTSLAGIEPVHMYAYESNKKRCFVAGSNHKNVRKFKESSALLIAPSGRILLHEIVKVIRNPLGLNSEVRLQEKYKKIKMSKTVDFLKNPR